ncbi:Wadjet anti-phage system protein JetA family protein [Alicyclobacillus macrosporangiidus]|uniref:Uncharacterized protein n=1 Tax=Alicyclobacillus macrosporangiidus TaxID=392015 RepID=A0A1I7G7Z2_9BACL|nr:Wadjet anti-phage system protein JetA family protein [Alicyclobacillus macrosporangiidus]SFU44582.1 hypothetical protein SAMN05421543_10257 [Alicyclobacillus macrosporangiidus]
MRNLFEVVPDNLFSLLAARHRAVYFRALMVLRECYQREITFRRADLVAYLISQMERDLTDLPEDEMMDADGVDPVGAPSASPKAVEAAPVQPVVPESPVDREAAVAHRSNAAGTSPGPDGLGDSDGSDGFGGFDDATLSGRAHALVRRLVQTGWLQSVTDGSGFDETLIVPQYASVLLDALHAIVEPVQQRYNAFVYSVYSNLRTANEERDEFMLQALQSAYDATVALRENLRALLHNIHTYYQNLHLRQDIRDLLAEHFDSYQLSVAIATYHPLKTFDSVYRFRPRILQILRDWLAAPSLLNRMSATLRQQRPELDDLAARGEIVRLIQFIGDTFESLDDLLREIDHRNAAYNRASVERLQYLLNSDRDIKGKLVQLLRALPPVHARAPSPLLSAMAELPLYEVRYFDPDALYTEPKRRQRGQPQPLRRPGGVDDAAFQEEAKELLERANALFSQQRIAEFILSQMDEHGRLPASALRLPEWDDFIRAIVAVVRGDEPEMPYGIEWDDETQTVVVGAYRIPALTFLRKEADRWTGRAGTRR